MADTIVIPVPERLLAVYVVTTSSPPDELAEHSAGGVAIDVVPVDVAPLPPAALLRAMGASTEALAKLGSATQAVIVQSVGALGFPPDPEISAYVAAQAVADACDGTVVDTVIPRVVETSRDTGDGFRLSDWVVLPHSPEDDGRLWFTTKGLARFGLPELQSRGVPDGAGNAWGAVLTGVAQVLLEQLGAALAADATLAFVELPAVQRISLRDIAAGYSDRSRTADDATLDVEAEIGLAWDPAMHDGADSFLTVQAAPGADDTWVADVVRTLFGPAA